MHVRETIRDRATWIRGLYMVLFWLLYSLAALVLGAVAIFQFGAVLLTGEPNAQLLRFGEQLSLYLYQIFLFETFNREERPFPFGPWPD